MMKKMFVLLLALTLCVGCALAEETLAQVDLPLPDAAVYVPDPFLREVTQLMIAHEEAERADWPDREGVEWDKTTTLVTLHLPVLRVEEEKATVFARIFSARYALWEDGRLRLMTGRLSPGRIELERVEGAWQIVSVTRCREGNEFWPSILAFCDGDELLASTLTIPVGAQVHDFAVERYLISLGYREAAQEDE